VPCEVVVDTKVSECHNASIFRMRPENLKCHHISRSLILMFRAVSYTIIKVSVIGKDETP
jgi:hypothetical protein